MTPIEYFEKQLQKHKINLDHATVRNAPEVDIHNIKLKITYYGAAVEVLKRQDLQGDDLK